MNPKATITDEQFQAYLKQIRELAEGPFDEMQKEIEVTNTFPEKFYELAKENDLYRFYLPEEYGGWNLNELEILKVQEEFSRGPGGMRMHLHHAADMNWRILEDYGKQELKDQLMDKFQDKTIFTCFALTEQSGGTGADIHTTAVKDENGDTMSKSKGNVVPPSSVIEPYGADTMRLAILFIAPPEKDFDWDPKAVEGANRFIKRAWRIVWQLVQSGDANVAFDKSALDEVAMKLYRERHRTIAKCTEDFDRGQFNTAISAVMELVNAASAYLNATEGTARDKALCYGVAKDIVSVLAPICPFWADELWHEALGCEGNAYTAAWPEFDLAESIEDTVQIVVQVLGKVRGRVDVARDASNEDMQAAAEAAVAKWLEGKTVVKAICVPGKLVNLVVK